MTELLEYSGRKQTTIHNLNEWRIDLNQTWYPAQRSIGQIANKFGMKKMSAEGYELFYGLSDKPV